MLDMQREPSRRVRLLKKRMRRFERRGKENETSRASCDARQCRVCGCMRSGPHQEYRVDTFETSIECLWNREIAMYDFDVCWHPSRFGAAGHGAHAGAFG